MFQGKYNFRFHSKAFLQCLYCQKAVVVTDRGRIDATVVPKHTFTVFCDNWAIHDFLNTEMRFLEDIRQKDRYSNFLFLKTYVIDEPSSVIYISCLQRYCESAVCFSGALQSLPF